MACITRWEAAFPNHFEFFTANGRYSNWNYTTSDTETTMALPWRGISGHPAALSRLALRRFAAEGLDCRGLAGQAIAGMRISDHMAMNDRAA